jgi:hypothetical protein
MKRVQLQRKSKGLVVALVTALLLCATAWLLAPSRSSITLETYQKVCRRMSRSEAEGVLGGTGGTRQDFVLWLDNRSPIYGPGKDLLNEHQNEPVTRYWYQDSGIVVVRFDSQDLVADKLFLSVRQSALRQKFNRLRERLPW